MLVAFGAENRSQAHGWTELYGGGFAVYDGPEEPVQKEKQKRAFESLARGASVEARGR